MPHIHTPQLANNKQNSPLSPAFILLLLTRSPLLALHFLFLLWSFSQPRRKIKCDVDRNQPCRNCEKNGVQCTMVGPSMRPPRATSGSSSAAAAAAVAMAMATAAHARFAGLSSSSIFQFEDMGDERLRGNFRRGDERFRQVSKTEGHGSAHFNPLQRRPSAPRMDDGLPVSDVHPRPSQRSLQSFSSSPTSLRNLFLSTGSARSSSISSTSPSPSSVPFGPPSPHHSRNHPLVYVPLSASSSITYPTFENHDYFHSFPHSSNATHSATSPIRSGGVDHQYSSSGHSAEPSSGPTFPPYSSSPVPSTTTQYASRSVDNILLTGYYERPRRVSPPPISPPLTSHVDYPEIYHSAPRRSASHPLLISYQPITAIADVEEIHHQYSGRQLPSQWPQSQLFGREIPTSLDSQKGREPGPYGETTTLTHMQQTEELEDEFDLPIDPGYPIVRSNSTPAIFSTFSPDFSSTGLRRMNEQLHTPLPEHSGFHQEMPSPAAEMTSPFFSTPHQFNSSYSPIPPPPPFSRRPDIHSIGNPAQHQPRRHSEQALSPRRQEPFITSQHSQHLKYLSQHGHTPHAIPGSFARVRGRSAMDEARNSHQSFEHSLFAGGQQDFQSGFGTQEHQLSTSGAGSAFDDTRDISSSPFSALPPTAPTPAAREWDIPDEYDEQVSLKQKHGHHPFHLGLHHVTEEDHHRTALSTRHQPPLSHAPSGQLSGQASTPSLGPMSSSSAQTGTAPHSSSTDVFDASLAFVLDNQLQLVDHLSIIHDPTIPGTHELDSTSLTQFGSDTICPSSHSSHVFSSRNSGTLPPSSSPSVSGTNSSAVISSSGGDTPSQVFGSSSHRTIKIEGHDSTMSESATRPFHQLPSKLGVSPCTNAPGPRQYQQPVAPDTEMVYSETPGQAQRQSFIQYPTRPSGMVAYHGDVMQSDFDRAPHPFDMPSSAAFGPESQHGYGTK